MRVKELGAPVFIVSFALMTKPQRIIRVGRMKEAQIIAFCGSIHTKSSNQIILRYLQERFRGICNIEVFPIESLPYFSPGVNPPSTVFKLYNAIERADALIFATPEYVFSLPGILKNALEWLVSTTVLDHKPTAMIIAAADGSHAYASLKKILQTLMTDVSSKTSLHVRGIKGKIKNGQIECVQTKQKIDRVIMHLQERIRHSEE